MTRCASAQGWVQSPASKQHRYHRGSCGCWRADDGGAKSPSSVASAAATAAVQAFEALHQAERLLAAGYAPAAADTVQAGSNPLSTTPL